MAITRNDVNESWDADGNLVASTPVVKDITEEATRDDLRAKARTALANNKTFLDTPNNQINQAQALVQLKATVRQVNALIRLMPTLEDLLIENDDT